MATCGLAQTTKPLKDKQRAAAPPVHCCALSMPSCKRLCCILSISPHSGNYTALTTTPWLAPLG